MKKESIRFYCLWVKESLQRGRNIDNGLRKQFRSKKSSPVNRTRAKITVSIEEKYIGIVLGKKHKIIETIETKSGTKIRIAPHAEQAKRKEHSIDLVITGEGKDCCRARSLILQRIISCNDRELRRKYGGDEVNKPFVCFNNDEQEEEFSLVLDKNTPSLDGFIKGNRFRIQSDDVRDEPVTTDGTIKDMKDLLRPPLKKLADKKSEELLLVDLWCHLGKVYVSNVDQEISSKGMTTTKEIKNRLPSVKTMAVATDNEVKWRVSFEEGVDETEIDRSLFPNKDEVNEDLFNLKWLCTQLRFDFAFITPSARYVRFKAWKGRDPENEEPPSEVKNILRPVVLWRYEDIKAWLCKPSVSVIRGEIMTPDSSYDCRIKLRAGPRYLDEDEKAKEEDNTLCDYLSKCKYDPNSGDGQMMSLPDPNDMLLPEGFECQFYREAKESFYQATMDGECFTIIVLEQKDWDSDGSKKRDKNQFGIRFILDSWSEKMLNPQIDWTPDDILTKLKDFMNFINLFKKGILSG
ncbi:uncharacterized protein LOC124440295 isoform X2 [Xenia sp. Carnegie-2017]|uniref:uncharacterized protein LOC124440295 isoform X2 n=1 Tax=Xenia sp. Carnegie-2017 TaxID=2897299 RepID=UPI001F0487CD|nr:uncharacterized protein LOC124440295 isoform X2 [Xenia sp. Carnegie-2017]